MVVFYKQMRPVIESFLRSELKLPAYQNNQFSEPPSFITTQPRRSRFHSDDVSAVTADPFDNLVKYAEITANSSDSVSNLTMSYSQRRQQVLDVMPSESASATTGFDITNLFEIEISKPTYANVARGPAPSTGSQSEISALTEENSRLTAEVQSLKATIDQHKLELDQQRDDLSSKFEQQTAAQEEKYKTELAKQHAEMEKQKDDISVQLEQQLQDKLQQQKDDLTSAFQQQLAEKDSVMQQKLATIHEEHATMNNTVHTLFEEVHRLKDLLSDYRTQNESLQNTVQYQSHALRAKEETLEAKDAMINRLIATSESSSTPTTAHPVTPTAAPTAAPTATHTMHDSSSPLRDIHVSPSDAYGSSLASPNVHDTIHVSSTPAADSPRPAMDTSFLSASTIHSVADDDDVSIFDDNHDAPTLADRDRNINALGEAVSSPIPDGWNEPPLELSMDTESITEGVSGMGIAQNDASTLQP